jgi:hypothetical protein
MHIEKLSPVSNSTLDIVRVVMITTKTARNVGQRKRRAEPPHAKTGVEMPKQLTEHAGFKLGDLCDYRETSDGPVLKQRTPIFRIGPFEDGEEEIRVWLIGVGGSCSFEQITLSQPYENDSRHNPPRGGQE